MCIRDRLGLALLAVPILLVVALVSIAGLKRRVGDLESQVYRPVSYTHLDVYKRQA